MLGHALRPSQLPRSRRCAPRREFAITWSLVARVPLFAGLDASAVAQIMTLLYSATYQEGDVIVRRGQPADTMFIIAAGEVIVETDQGEVRLGEGEFFGELALLEHRPHQHRVTAASKCRCLVLDRADLERFGRRHPEITRRVHEVAKKRQADFSA